MPENDELSGDLDDVFTEEQNAPPLSTSSPVLPAAHASPNSIPDSDKPLPTPRPASIAEQAKMEKIVDREWDKMNNPEAMKKTIRGVLRESLVKNGHDFPSEFANYECERMFENYFKAEMGGGKKKAIDDFQKYITKSEKALGSAPSKMLPIYKKLIEKLETHFKLEVEASMDQQVLMLQMCVNNYHKNVCICDKHDKEPPEELAKLSEAGRNQYDQAKLKQREKRSETLRFN